jgi:hypothetical protein
LRFTNARYRRLAEFDLAVFLDAASVEPDEQYAQLSLGVRDGRKVTRVLAHRPSYG